MTNEYSLNDILSLNVEELVNAMYLELKENNAEKDDNATFKFGNRNFEAELIVKIKR